ncbi:MAG: hypothetical protein ABIZ56_02115, partial [Chthoniobacteraceae bacterium]
MRRIFLIALLGIVGAAHAQRLSPLAPAPDWREFEVYQETITRVEFTRLLDEIYAPQQAAAGLIEIGEEAAVFRQNLAPGDTFVLRFAKNDAHTKPIPRYWRNLADIPRGSDPTRPLAGVKIAIDPGHLGGDWAKMEERWFQIGDTLPVTEGDMTLRVARLLAPQLTALGAEVTLVRSAPGPTTPERPESLREAARVALALQGTADPPETYADASDPLRATSVQFQSELLFFRTAEIRHRAEVVNTQIRPDFVLCLHFDADAWGDAKVPSFTPNNYLHALIHGTCRAAELRNDDVRHDMLLKLLDRTADAELAACETVIQTMARRLALPPRIYTRDTARRPGASPYVWARNLLANRIYRCPVVFLEAYAMNNREVWERIQAGDYEGQREVAGSRR